MHLSAFSSYRADCSFPLNYYHYLMILFFWMFFLTCMSWLQECFFCYLILSKLWEILDQIKYEERLCWRWLQAQALPVWVLWPSGNNFTSMKNRSGIELWSCSLFTVIIQGHRAPCGWAITSLYITVYHWEVVRTLNDWKLWKHRNDGYLFAFFHNVSISKYFRYLSPY